MRRLIAATTVLLLGTALAGCTDSDQPEPPSSTSTPAPTEPTATETDGPPELPEAATEKTTAGAKAFLGYYIDVLDYAYATPAIEPLRSISPDSCATCQVYVRVVGRLVRGGGVQEGGELTVHQVVLFSRRSASQLGLLADVDIARGVSRESPDSEPNPIKPRRIKLEIFVRWLDHSWRLESVRPA